MHIADVIEMLSSQIREMMSNNSGAALAKDSGASLSLSEMASAMKQFPEFRGGPSPGLRGEHLGSGIPREPQISDSLENFF